MAHQILELDKMAHYGEAPWHNLSTEVSHVMTAKEALEAANLSWQVEKQEIMLTDGQVLDGFYATVRADHNYPLGVVKERYKVVQNSECFDLLDSIVADNGAKYHTCGSLFNGRKVWLLAKLPSNVRVGSNDIIDPYILLSTSHDGSSGLQVMLTPIRVVCNNTLTMAVKGANNKFNIRHTTNAKNKIVEARKVLGLSVQYYEKFEEMANHMLAQPFSQYQLENVLKQLNGVENKEIKDLHGKSKNKIEKVVELFETGIGITEENRGTAWAAYNAVTEYTDHAANFKGTEEERRENRLHSIWAGNAASYKDKALAMILDTTNSHTVSNIYTA